MTLKEFYNLHLDKCGWCDVFDKTNNKIICGLNGMFEQTKYQNEKNNYENKEIVEICPYGDDVYNSLWLCVN